MAHSNHTDELCDPCALTNDFPAVAGFDFSMIGSDIEDAFVYLFQRAHERGAILTFSFHAHNLVTDHGAWISVSWCSVVITMAMMMIMMVIMTMVAVIMMMMRTTTDDNDADDGITCVCVCISACRHVQSACVLLYQLPLRCPVAQM